MTARIELVCNVWEILTKQDWLCITTNYGWKKDFSNVMGRGIAREASQRFKNLSLIYGKHCRNYYETTKSKIIPIVAYSNLNLIMFATKALKEDNPHLSWQQNSSLIQIKHSAITLKAWIIENEIDSKVYLPRPGCSNGKLDWREVKPLVDNLPQNVIFVTNLKDVE